MPRSRVDDPIQKYRYIVAVPGMPAGAGFSKVGGLKKERGVTEYAEGGYDAIHKIPGREKGGELELERGLMLGSSLLKSLFAKSLLDPTFRFDVIVTVMSAAGLPAATYLVQECWAGTWEGPELEGTSDDVAIEKITLPYEKLTPQ